MNITKKWIPLCLTVIIFAVSLFAGIHIFAQGPEDVCKNGTDEQKNSAYCQSLNDPNADPVASGGIVRKVTDIISYAAGVIGVFWIIIQAIKMATSQGNAEKISSSRNGIIYAVVGLAVVLVARTVIIFALNRL
jgi:hypothetical protein